MSLFTKVLIAINLLAQFAIAGLDWQKIGNLSHVMLDNGDTVILKASNPVLAGVISRAIAPPGQTDAILIKANISQAESRSVTFTIQDAQSGQCIGYWQNPLPIKNTTPISTILNLSQHADKIRIFAGTHNQTSNAEISEITYQPLRSGMTHHGDIYGARISGEKTVHQTFRATGNKLGGVVIRIRRLGQSKEGPNLRARLYDWIEGVDRSVNQPYLAETSVPRHQIPGTLEDALGDFEIAATYVGGARELAIPLDAIVIPGKSYLLELAVDGPCENDQGYLSYSWVDGYVDGCLYENSSTCGRNWDLYLETYDAQW